MNPEAPTLDDVIEQAAATTFPPSNPAEAGPAPHTDPPKRGRPPGAKSKQTKSSPPRPPGRPSTRDERAKRVATLYETAGTMLTMGAVLPGVPNRAAAVGSAMREHSANLGNAWADWAQTNDRVRKLIDGLSFGGGAVAVVMAHVMLVMPVVMSPPPDDEQVAMMVAGEAMSPGMVDALAAMLAGGAGVHGSPSATPA